MLAAIRNLSVHRAAKFALLIGIAGVFSSCATKEKPSMLSSASEKESSIPWNEHKDWETQGQLAGMAERLNAR
jgi:NADH:ubiquinone oxidoreductase subunit 5 (subunit L)/multisubunit Na+/H+ antiporter MnhA subunit